MRIYDPDAEMVEEEPKATLARWLKALGGDSPLRAPPPALITALDWHLLGALTNLELFEELKRLLPGIAEAEGPAGAPPRPGRASPLTPRGRRR